MLYIPYLATPHLIYHAEHYIKSFCLTLSPAGAVAQLQVHGNARGYTPSGLEVFKLYSTIYEEPLTPTLAAWQFIL